MLNSFYFLRDVRDQTSRVKNHRKLRMFAVILTVGVVSTQVFPTLAENTDAELNPPGETSTVLGPIETDLSLAEDSDLLGEGGSLEDAKESETSGESLDTSTEDSAPPPPPPPPPPPFATSSQAMLITMPTSVRVDPRANSVFLPRMLFYSSNTLLVCISSGSLRFDIGTRGVIDDGASQYIRISGDQTSNLLVSGISTWVTGYLNSENGMRIYSDIGSVGKKSALFRFIDISEPSLNEKLCTDGDQANYRFVEIMPLGLSQSISKGSVGLKKGGN